MKPAASRAAPHSALVQQLERTFRAGEAEATACAPGFPLQLWQPALLQPLREFLAQPGKQLRASLVELGFALAGGGAGACPPELPLLVEALHAGSLIVDDIEDGSLTRRGAPSLHARHGVPVALNTGNWLYFWAQALLAHSALDDAQRLLAHERIAARLLACHEGQGLDLTVRVVDLAQREVARGRAHAERMQDRRACSRSRSSSARSPRARPSAYGARSAQAAARPASGLQMLDDLSGVLNPQRRHKGCEDLALGRATWLWAWLSEDLDANAYAASCRALHAVGTARARNACSNACASPAQNGRRRARASSSTRSHAARRARPERAQPRARPPARGTGAALCRGLSARAPP